MSGYEDGLPIEEFIQALTSQLDRAQSALALKVRAGLPLTFAVRDISIDLRAHVGMREAQVLIQPAGPRDQQASVIRLALTTITRPMIEENTLQITPDDQPLHEVLGDEVTEEERRRLEWAGIRTVSQLRNLERESGEHVIEQVAQIPAMRLRAALERAARPAIARLVPEGPQRLRIEGRNLLGGEPPRVRIGEVDAPVLRAADRELLVAPPDGVRRGTLRLETAPGLVLALEFDLDQGGIVRAPAAGGAGGEP